MVHVVYLWTNSTTDNKARARSDDVIEAIRGEIAPMPPGPHIIIGDFNIEPLNMFSTKNLIYNGWTDMVSVTSNWGGMDLQPTCEAHSANEATSDH